MAFRKPSLQFVLAGSHAVLLIIFVFRQQVTYYHFHYAKGGANIYMDFTFTLFWAAALSMLIWYGMRVAMKMSVNWVLIFRLGAATIAYVVLFAFGMWFLFPVR